MGKTGDLFKKTGDTKGTFHAKMGTVKDRNGIDLIEAEDIKKRQQKNSEKAVAPHSSTLAWKIPWMEEPGGLQSMGLLRVGYD